MSLYQCFYSGIPNWFKMYLCSEINTHSLAQPGFSVELGSLLTTTSMLFSLMSRLWSLVGSCSRRTKFIGAAWDRSHIHNSWDHLLQELSLLFLWGCSPGLLLAHKFQATPAALAVPLYIISAPGAQSQALLTLHPKQPLKSCPSELLGFNKTGVITS